MFSLNVVDTDDFIEMPVSSRLLYYELGMRADDDGFVDNWKKIIKMTGLAEDDMKILIAKQYIIPFENGVIVIRHWRLNNYLRNDRHHPTTHQKELSQLSIENDVYELESTEKSTMLPSGSRVVYLDKNRLDKTRLDKGSIDRVYVDDFVATYTLHCPNLPQIRTVTDSRKKAIGNFKKTYTLKDWEEVCKKASESDFLLRCKRQRLESGL